MSTDNPISSSGIQPGHNAEVLAERAAKSAALAKSQLAQTASQEGLEAFSEEGAAFNPFAMARNFETLSQRSRRTSKEEQTGKAKKEEGKERQVERVGKIADSFARNSQEELQSRTLLLIRQRISKNDTPEDIIRKVLETYSDYALADEVLDFLLETSDPEIAEIVKQAKEQLNANFSREIRAGRNINAQAREFAEQGLGKPTALRDMYRDITGNPRDANTLFEQLSSQFNYDKLKTVISFMLHALGADLKNKGPSIPRGELHRLLTETRVLQGILGVYRFYQSRMKLMTAAFVRRGLVFPSRISFEILARIFMRYLQERYPSPDKILQISTALGLGEEVEGQLIILTQMRDATRQVAPRLFRNDQHRLDTLRSFMEALKHLDDELEEEEQEEEEDEKGRKLKRPKKPKGKLS